MIGEWKSYAEGLGWRVGFFDAERDHDEDARPLHEMAAPNRDYARSAANILNTLEVEPA